MAHPKRRLPANAPGEFYVDATCIDCDTCRWLAPETFLRVDGQSAVARQPHEGEERRRAALAAVACPTASIGTQKPAPEIPAARAAFPLPVEGGVFYCGYHSPKSFGAASYLILREGGNVLVDSPRFSPTLAAGIESLGGVKWLFLTHGDDIADHRAWRERFGCERILHRGDVTEETRGVERVLDGNEAHRLADDLLILPVPGHTEGSCVLLYREEFLFSGDHVAYSPRLGHLYAFRDACWHSWPRLIHSMESLRAYPFRWVLPGHGRRLHAEAGEMSAQLEACLAWMRDSQPAAGD